MQQVCVSLQSWGEDSCAFLLNHISAQVESSDGRLASWVISTNHIEEGLHLFLLEPSIGQIPVKGT